MMKASRLFSSLDPQTVRTWNAYAATLKTFDEATGRVRCPSGQNVFAGYCCKLWQMDDSVDVPTTPPASPFLGDGITVTVSANGPALVFTGSGPNAANVVTELLIQPLKSGARTPLKRDYRSANFASFSHSFPGALVVCGAGWVACAVRFVRVDTGQSSALLELGVVQVGEDGTEDGPLPIPSPFGKGEGQESTGVIRGAGQESKPPIPGGRRENTLTPLSLSEGGGAGGGGAGLLSNAGWVPFPHGKSPPYPPVSGGLSWAFTPPSGWP